MVNVLKYISSKEASVKWGISDRRIRVLCSEGLDSLIDLAHTTMNYEPFIALVSELVIESEKLWLSVLD